MSEESLFSTPSSTHSQSATRFIACALLAMIAMGMSVWAYQHGGPLLTWGIFPGAPLVILAGMSLVPRIPLRVTIGAYVGGLLALAVPYGAIWSSSLNYNGGGANIGLGLLLLATLVLLPFPMAIGGFIGSLMVPKHKASRLNETSETVNPSGVC